MTQSTTTRTATHLLTAVLSAATGAPLAPLSQVAAVVHDLSDGTIPPDEIRDARGRVRAELIRQIPWLAEIRVPDFNDPDIELIKCEFIAGLAAACGGSVDIECGTLATRLGVPPNAKIVRNR